MLNLYDTALRAHTYAATLPMAPAPTPKPGGIGQGGVTSASLNWPGIITLVGIALTFILILFGLGMAMRSKQGDMKGAGSQSGVMTIAMFWVAMGAAVGGALMIGLFSGLIGNIVS